MILSNQSFNWLDLIPNQWEIDKVKDHFYFSNIQTENFDNYPVLSLTMSGVKKRNMDTNEGQLPESYEKYNLVDPSCLVFNPMDLISGWVDVPKTEGLISPSYRTIKLRSEKTNLHFIKYYFQSLYKEKVLFYFGEGVHYDYRWGLGKETLKNFPIPIPSKEEQNKIVGFLDKKNTQIEKLIKKIEQKIELLKEQRTSLINEVVTKGLNPDVEMKDSGVEWIGETPKHWTLSKVKYVSTIKRGSSPRPIDDPRYFDEEGDYGWVRISDVTKCGKFLTKTDQKLSELGKSLSLPIEDKTLCMSISGSVGKVFITTIKCCIHDGFVSLNNPQINQEFFYLLLTNKELYSEDRKLGTQYNINSGLVGNKKIPIPSKVEQREIVEYLERETKIIDETISKEEKRIELLKEYKQSLISEVVTGKKRVV